MGYDKQVRLTGVKVLKDFTEKCFSTNEEKILIKKINDMLQKSERTHKVVYSHFLTPAEQNLLAEVDEFRRFIGFYGGYEDAERRVCRLCLDEYCTDAGLPVRLYAVQASKAEFSHRDVLGSLVALGLKREMIGDIYASGGTALFFCHESVGDFIELNLKKIGRYRVDIDIADIAAIPKPNFKLIEANVSAMRLDSVAAACFGISRTKITELIRQGLVSKNWLVSVSSSEKVKPGDKISVRGKGKAEVLGISGFSKKGRIFLEIKIYI